ncbi:MAG: malto-oligosyltrehalose synthase [Bryobacter sp.]|nr:malto-oligosyltrehalose synthase [Bryobacter sp.]
MPAPLSPLSTYRLQLTPAFGFAEAESLVPYFAELGISHLYLSPIWRARPGSQHGYDICDAREINPELGGEDGFRRLSHACQAHGMGIVLDFVSNHMCADPGRNPTWRDTLRNGPSSLHADAFDIDWAPVKRELRNKVLLPILGRQYGEVLEAGELKVVYEGGEFCLRYWEHDLPLNPRQARLILRHRWEELQQLSALPAEDLQEYQSILFQLDHVPPYWEVAEDAREDRLRELSVAGQRLARLLKQSPHLAAHLERNLVDMNGRVGEPESFDLLHELLEQQAYRLSYWRTALHEINYRRFFDINELAGLRMENPRVFAEAHAKLFELLRSGLAQGVRLDHIDGLYDPTAYLTQLRAELAAEAPHAYIVVEKILSAREPLAAVWPIDGTTGYDFLNELNHLYVHAANFAVLRRVYQRFLGRAAHFEHIVYEGKQQIISTSLASELNVLAHELNRISEQDRHSRDFTLDSLQEALREVAACFPVYRTYIGSDGEISEADRAAVDEAIRHAIERNPALEASIFEFIRECLCPLPRITDRPSAYERRLRFALKFQQYTGPVQAKGIEDTAFYRYCPLVSLNEVGGEPVASARAVEAFHAANLRRLAHHPLSMLATSTHDTKRSEDARARLNVLSEMPGEWRTRLREWSRLTAPAKTGSGRRALPDRNDEYLFYQNLLAIWPEGETAASGELVERMKAYLSKAIKEAKVHTSWINPSNEYDRAVERFVERALRGKAAPRFLASFVPFAERVAAAGRQNSLSQLTLKLAAPGVPDIYQGTEFFDYSLVDPDNRRPVDFSMRKDWCEGSRQTRVAEGEPGAQKALMLRTGLRMRQASPELFRVGDYVPLVAEGAGADHVVAFARLLAGEGLVAVGLRWFLTWQANEAGSTRLPLPPGLANRTARNLYTGEEIACGEALELSVLRGLAGGLLHFPRTLDTL